MRCLLTVVWLLVPATASAMGSYERFELVAWSRDGRSALVVRTHTSSGTVGSHQSYTLLTTSGEARTFTFTSTEDVDTPTEHIDRATCETTARAAQRALAERRFSGVTAHPEHCATTRTVIAVDPAAQNIAAASWVASPTDRSPTPRERAGDEARTLVLHDDPGASADVATRTGDLVLVFYGVNGDSSGPKWCAAVVRTKSGYQIAGTPRAASSIASSRILVG